MLKGFIKYRLHYRTQPQNPKFCTFLITSGRKSFFAPVFGKGKVQELSIT